MDKPPVMIPTMPTAVDELGACSAVITAPTGIIATHSAAPKRNPRRHTVEMRFASRRIHQADTIQTTPKVKKAGTSAVRSPRALEADNMATAIYARKPERNPSTIATVIFIFCGPTSLIV